jgi:myo-inositol-1(or 4)-monophosphatase
MKNQDLGKEREFFHEIAPIIISYIRTASRKIAVLKTNTANKVEFATAADIGVEEIIVREIRRRFPKDNIVAEETAPDIPSNYKGRYWFVDPICGTTNFSRGSNLYATNIALAENEELIAACVIDHNEGEHIWSTGDNKVYNGKRQLTLSGDEPPYIIEFEFSTANATQDKDKTKFTKFTKNILQETNYYITSYATSLAFTYTALGKIDAYIVPRARIWDIAAPIFLTLQVGGIISELNGKPWTLHSSNVLGARDKKLHKKIVDLLNL